MTKNKKEELAEELGDLTLELHRLTKGTEEYDRVAKLRRRAYSRWYYYENREKILNNHYKYAMKNLEKLKEYRRRYYLKNRERINSINKANYHKNKLKKK